MFLPRVKVGVDWLALALCGPPGCDRGSEPEAAAGVAVSGGMDLREGSRVEFRGTFKGPTKARDHIHIDVAVESESTWVHCRADLEHTKAIGNIPLDSLIVVTGRLVADTPPTLADCTFSLPGR